MQTTKEISYSELSDKVKDSVLFNNHDSVDEYWYEGLIVSPLMQEKLDELDAERRAEALQEIAESKDESEKAKLTEELEDIDPTTVMDLCEGCIYQTYAITSEGARFLFNHTTEIISYSEKLGIYLWHITHFGTSWSGVHTTLHEWDWENTPEWYAYSDSDIMKYVNGY